METYGFTQSFSAMDFFRGRWPFLFISLAWAYFLAPRFTLETPAVPITYLDSKKESRTFHEKATAVYSCIGTKVYTCRDAAAEA